MERWETGVTRRIGVGHIGQKSRIERSREKSCQKGLERSSSHLPVRGKDLYKKRKAFQNNAVLPPSSKRGPRRNDDPSSGP